MTAIAAGARRRGGLAGRRIGRFWSAVSAVSIKELRGRMRGRRAFAVLTVYLLLLGLFAFAIYYYLKQQAALPVVNTGIDFPRDPTFPGFAPGVGQTLSNGTALSAGIGHGIFGGLLFLETLLVLVLAPAFTTGAISLEREKQTLDLLVTTPLSTLGMIIGKLFSALTYVFLLILASVPLSSLVFVFGGVGPEDLLRAYGFLFALAFGMGAVGLFISAIVKRTQTATVVTFVIVLLLSIGTAAVHQFWQVATRPTTNTSVIISSRPGKAPEAVLWLNPFVADLDMVCATAPDSYHASCDYISSVTNRPYFGTPSTTTNPPVFEGIPQPMPFPDAGGAADDFVIGDCPPGARCTIAVNGGGAAPQPNAGSGADGTSAQVAFGFPRDTFWPKSAAAFLVMGITLTLASAQLVSPTRRLRIPRPSFSRRRRNQTPTRTSDSPPTLIDETAVQETEAVTTSTSSEDPETTE
jgi:ABC-type transport system involved in multi-copper enzyme maturation permease subunit